MCVCVYMRARSPVTSRHDVYVKQTVTIISEDIYVRIWWFSFLDLFDKVGNGRECRDRVKESVSYIFLYLIVSTFSLDNL